ncbi:transmembrane protein 68 [Protobothrops mucrosquamatus]|uniref:transmembrane protein 68 n=1 Tax=Protobothrops mucrosquamatus TaxID=103944 RepID=UPI0010FB2A69|nr:transmembrane protein 68 [Protobothrops mucrosquamatus]
MNSFSVGQGNLTWVMELLNSINISPNNIINSFTDYSAYFFWMSVLFLLLFSPVVIILGFIYLSNFLLHIYKRKVNLKEDYLSQSWDNGRRAVAHLWDMYGTVWHGYEIHGMDKIPEGPGLIVSYHGAFPLDYFYFVSRLYLRTDRFCRTVVDYHFSKIPGTKLFYNVEGLTHNGRNYLNTFYVGLSLKTIQKLQLVQNVVMQEVNGARYMTHVTPLLCELHWLSPVIPIFTKNLREGYRALGKIWPFKWLYERTRWPIVPIYGGFPVKFCTYIGDPIPYDPNISAEELAEKTKSAIKDLRDKHQEIPGNVQKALLERLEKHPEK